MFATLGTMAAPSTTAGTPSDAALQPGTGRTGTGRSGGILADQGALLGRHATLVGSQTVDVDPTLRALLPHVGLRRGTTTGLRGPSGATSLVLALIAGALRAGSWGAVVGLEGLGVEAAADLAVPLERLALIPSPGAAWAEVTGTLLGAMDVVVLYPPARCRNGVARRLAARCRERRSLLLVVEGRERQSWPEPLDLQLEVRTLSWHGIERGAGTLTHRLVEIRAGGRRAGRPERTSTVWLPGPDGGVGPAPAR